MNGPPLNGTPLEEPLPESPDSLMADNISIASGDDWNSYFTERHGRQFHSGTAQYFLPADMVEMQRLRRQHECLRLLLNGSNHFGPIVDRLQPGPRKRVVDLGSGSGIWIESMADDFEHVRFIGIDLVPATRQSPENGIPPLTGFRLEHGRLDGFGRLAHESFRVLRPLGLFLSAELDFRPQRQVGLPDTMANTRELLRRAVQCAERGGTAYDPDQIQHHLQDAGFDEITPDTRLLPIGDWHEDQILQQAGDLARDVTIEFATALRPALLDLPNTTPADVDTLLGAATAEIQASHGWSMPYRMVHARRPA
ncbi:hypothetical protein FRB99_002976 [Tulasnella sp. 403]|nr:hypothetical protein FRB99_002976 [Tulasnella sp. 403]